MDYEIDIFVSYARCKLWTPWVRDVFVPRLEGYLLNEVGSVKIFVDDQINAGADWEQVLMRNIAISRLMVPLFSAYYFQRDWCRREMALMLERERDLGLIKHSGNYGLIIPVRLGDGLCFPDLARRLQCHDFEEFADPDIAGDSSRATKFNVRLNGLAKTIAATLPIVPCWRETWQKYTGDDFFPSLAATPLGKQTPPRIVGT